MILKILMVIINSVIFLAGAAFVVIGVLVEIGKQNVLAALVNNKDLSPELTQLANASYILIAVGAVLAFMGFLGCCGACCESKCMLLTFFIIILIVFIVEVAAAVLILFYRPAAEKVLNKIRQEVAENIMENYDQNNIITTAWNQTMSQLKCCGYNNYTDFTGSEFVNRTSLYPQFCCSTKPEQCDVGQAQSEQVDGCFNAVVKLLKNNSTVLTVVAICVAVIEVAAMIISLILYKK